MPPQTPNSSIGTPNPRSRYWRSLDELEFTPEFQNFLHREFPVAASEFPEGVSRRRWLQLMGASFALAGVAGCRWEHEQFLPAAGRVPDYIPGEPQFFATSYDLGGVARPLVVTCFDGRPVKVEGNPQHPASQGAVDAFGQALMLDLYDPDRVVSSLDAKQVAKPILRTGKSRTLRSWRDAAQALRKSIETAGDGSAVRILSAASSSPSRDRLEQSLLEKLPSARWIEYEPISWQAVEAGAQQATGQRVRPVYDLAAADIILTLDADLLGMHPNKLAHTRAWASRRTPETGSMNRLYAVESQYTITGVSADHREPVRSSNIPVFLDDLEAGLDGTAAKTAFLKAVVSDLMANRGKGLIAIGPGQPPELHARVHRLNERLGNVGSTVRFVEEPRPERPDYVDAMTQLVGEMKSGAVKTLIILRGNPVYDAPADLDFAAELAKLPNAIHVSDYDNETSHLCNWYLPATHPFEEWGDALSYEGLYTLRQPLIEPLSGAKSELEVLAMLLGIEAQSGEQIVRETFNSRIGGSENDWRKALHDGFVEGSGSQMASVSFGQAGPSPKAAKSAAGFEVVFCESEHLFDGRFANNGWLQEMPGFLSKLTWDNAAFISIADAAKLQVKSEDGVRITVGGKSIDLPVYVMPGQAIGSIGLALGYGRTLAGMVGGYTLGGSERAADSVGTNVYPLRTTKSLHFATGAKVEKIPGLEYELALTQDHFSIDTIGMKEIAQRTPNLIREGTAEMFAVHPEFAKHRVHHPELESLWESPDYAVGHAWGMSIDLSKCTGCNACIIACQSENNVPIVGKEQVRRGREMHWLRIDRYFRGNPVMTGEQSESGEREGVVVVGQPVLCMHCEHAPCEQVCPVAATLHDEEGLNTMIYNRCVGTRYCSNNCPYKVRRFNFLNYEKQPVNRKYMQANAAIAAMVRNPEVTVRSRGVMEKCTYCTQRIQKAKIEAKNDQRPIPDGTIKTACQQTCPADAIVFGDLLDEGSRVKALHLNPRSYGMLEELNVRPRTRYLARIRNPHPSLNEPYSIPAEGHMGGHHEEHSRTPGSGPGEEHDEKHDAAGMNH